MSVETPQSPLTPVHRTSPKSRASSPEVRLSESNVEIYQSVSKGAIIALVFGLLGTAAFAFVTLIVVPIAGLIAATLSLRAFRRYPDELLGRPVAIIGGILCAGTIIAAPAYHIREYLTEVPEGYERVDFMSLTAQKGAPDIPTNKAIEINGDSIFIKGYIHPSSMDTMMAKKFVIVPDLGTCCFGGQPPLTNMIEVTLTGDQYATKSLRKQRLAGEFQVNSNLKPIEGLTGVYYHLRADVIK